MLSSHICGRLPGAGRTFRLYFLQYRCRVDLLLWLVFAINPRASNVLAIIIRERHGHLRAAGLVPDQIAGAKLITNLRFGPARTIALLSFAANSLSIAVRHRC
jgi:hypothetical protein